MVIYIYYQNHFSNEIQQEASKKISSRKIMQLWIKGLLAVNRMISDDYHLLEDDTVWLLSISQKMIIIIVTAVETSNLT
jgi:hypothetical protein